MTATQRPVTLITGASGGIGHALARVLAPQHDLILSGRDDGRLATLQAEVGGVVLPLDLTRPETFEAAVAGLCRVTNVVHNAGVGDLGAVADVGHAVWTHTLAVNTVAPAELTRVLLPRLRTEKGRVVFVNSGAGRTANPGWGAYAASKFALRALADALRAEEAPHGVRVGTVYPGRTATPMQSHVRFQEGGEYLPQEYLDPVSVALAIAFMLAAPDDADLTELMIRPGPRP
ncbi:SDR family oxidoreductase [uncultured Deinococcus sp.]|uniref:SDR family oxidoreductase n=1 Tax=uncultured Deinococcus sp. TaxID=158789 RepID=UPI0025F8B1A6|nr:SDR family oxidoreductase [uncultured Deinococcus sp.]